MARVNMSRSTGAIARWVFALPIATGGQAGFGAVESQEASWLMFRGNPQLTGVAEGSLPNPPALRWKADLPDALSSTAAITADAVYVGCEDGQLHTFEPGSGVARWKYQANSPIRSSPTVHGGMVLFGDEEGILHAVSAAEGKALWTFRTAGPIYSSPNHAGDRIVFGSYDGFLYCIQAADGGLLWKWETQGRVHGAAGIAGDHAIFAGCDEYLHVVRLTDGQELRKAPLGSVSGSSAALSGPRSYVGTYGGQVRCVDWEKGAAVWTFEDSQRQFPFVTSAAVSSRSIIIGGRDKRLRSLDPQTGRVQWEFAAKGRIDSSAVLVDRRAFVGSSDGNLYSVDADSGKELWRFEAGAPITASPAVGGGSLIVGTQDGILYCFGSARRPS